MFLFTADRPKVDSTPQIAIPHNWAPRRYQFPAWDWMAKAGKRTYLVWPRRSGKDELALRWLSRAAVQRAANYWHMLPEAAQARKSMWDAVNPRTGKRRIREVFPEPMVKGISEAEMLIEFTTGATYQLVGSDNYDSLMGASPAGIVLSEWALAKPKAWAHLEPILEENGGWALFITTPRGKNHAHTMAEMAQRTPSWFYSHLTAPQTGVFSDEQLEGIKRGLIDNYGEAVGVALYNQEYMCSFDSALVGSIYGEALAQAKQDGRIREVPYRRDSLVHTFWDLGHSDATSIWFAQMQGGRPAVIDFYTNHNKDLPFYAGVLASKGYQYAKAWLPHDGKQVRVEAVLGSAVSVLQKLGYAAEALPALDQVIQINNANAAIARCWFDAEKCADGLEALGAYRWDYDDESGVSGRRPVHDWSSHAADAFETLGQALDRIESSSHNSKMSKPIQYRTKYI